MMDANDWRAVRIEQLEAEIAELKKQVAQLEQDPNDIEYGISVVAWSKHEEVKRQLASCQAQNQRLRESLETCTYSEGYGGTNRMGHEIINAKYYFDRNLVDEALTLPTDDSALYEFGMKVIETWVDKRDLGDEEVVREVMGK